MIGTLQGAKVLPNLDAVNVPNVLGPFLELQWA